MVDLESNILMNSIYGLDGTTFDVDYIPVVLQRMQRKRHNRIDKIKRMKERRAKWKKKL